MAITIGSNIASIQAQRRLGEATSSLSTVYERLSSGKRINKASDDAAGLAISEDLNVKSRIFGQAIRNINDGISVHAIADGAVSALSDIVIRLKELTEQSANGTYSNTQRKALDNEAQALAKEYLRVSRTTEFNGQKLFDGSLADGLRLQVGVGIEGSILTHIGGKLGTGTVGTGIQLATETNRSYASQLADINNDGMLDLVTTGANDVGTGYATVRLGNGNGNFGAATSYTTESLFSNGLMLGDLNGDGNLDMVTAGSDSSPDGYATVRLGSGNGSFGAATSYTTESNSSLAFSLGDLNGDGILDLISAGQSHTGDGYATVRLGRGNGSFGATTSYTTESNSSGAVSLGDLNGDGILDLVTAGMADGIGGYATVRLGSGSGSFGAATSYTTEGNLSRALSLGDLNGDGILDLVTAGMANAYDGYATIRLGSGNGSFGAATSYSTENCQSYALSLGDLNGDGILDMITAGRSDTYIGYATIRLGSGNGSFGAASSYTTEGNTSRTLSLGDLNGDGVTDLVTAGYKDSPYDGFATVRLGNTRDGISPLQPFSLKTQADALQAMGLFTNALNNLSTIRGTLGANESRLNVANATLAVAKENYLSASSRITDADMAAESANLIRTQILQQAGAAVLSQANQAPALAITLLT